MIINQVQIFCYLLFRWLKYEFTNNAGYNILLLLTIINDCYCILVCVCVCSAKTKHLYDIVECRLNVFDAGLTLYIVFTGYSSSVDNDLF